ncbi:MAG: pectinesterase family protein [Nitrospira sp.]|nr:pectinesterase family protein [Nitrospira sp.]MDH4302857.1 pectinesterase family protein [Nitrospira sp.]MDH5192992.1 pectinesterase family protein [Nitrospira sp.]
MYRLLLIVFCSALSAGVAVAGADGLGPSPRTITVALDGSGDFSSIQEAVDSAGKGDTVLIKAGVYPQDLTIHSKEGIKIVGAGVEKVVLQGRGQMVGVLHVGKWPYGATDIDISGLTINEHGGHALGIFNGNRIVLRHLHVKGMVFSQQVQEVRIEDCVIVGSETTGAHFSDSHATLVGNFIHDNDYGVNVTGKSSVRLERNVITRSLFEAVVIGDQSAAVLVNNTLVKNGGGATFLGASRIEAMGNILSFNKIGFLIAPSSQAKVGYNLLFNGEADYMWAGSPNRPAPELKANSDIFADPRFVDVERDDFHLQPGSTLLGVGGFPHLGALPPGRSGSTQ